MTLLVAAVVRILYMSCARYGAEKHGNGGLKVFGAQIQTRGHVGGGHLNAQAFSTQECTNTNMHTSQCAAYYILRQQTHGYFN